MPMMTSATGKTSSLAAFTLVEILVSVSILAVGLAGVMAAFDVCLSTLSVSNDRIHASFLMKEVMSGIEQDGADSAAGGRFSGADAGFSWRTEVRPVSRPSGATVNEVVVSVWRETRAQAIYSLATYVRAIPSRQ